MPLIPALRPRQEGLCEFKARLVHITSSRTAERDSVSKKGEGEKGREEKAQGQSGKMAVGGREGDKDIAHPKKSISHPWMEETAGWGSNQKPPRVQDICFPRQRALQRSQCGCGAVIPEAWIFYFKIRKWREGDQDHAEA